MANNYRIALAGNPNTGKSTLFNVLTGSNQHTGNWPGKTVLMAKGRFAYDEVTFEMIDLPGTYSLFSNSTDEQVARDYIIFDKPDVTIVVVDATALERNLNLALQVLEITQQVIVCINLIDEAEKEGIIIDHQKMERMLGVPVLKISARNEIGLDKLKSTLVRLVSGELLTEGFHVRYNDEIEEKIAELVHDIGEIPQDLFSARWLALRMLDGDEQFLSTLKEQMEARSKGVILGGNTFQASSN